MLDQRLAVAMNAVCDLSPVAAPQSLGDIIMDIMKRDGSESMTLAELVYEIYEVREVRCFYKGKKYKVQFGLSDKVPQIEVRDVLSGRAWLVMLKGRILKLLYREVVSRLSLAVNNDRVGIVHDSIRGSIKSAFGGFSKTLGIGLHDSMGPEEMSEFLGERLFDPTRRSSHLEYVEL